MTIDDIASMGRPYITVRDAGPVIGVRPDTLRYQAQQDPSRLGFPVCVAGNTVRIPREAFIAWMRGQAIDPRPTAQKEG